MTYSFIPDQVVAAGPIISSTVILIRVTSVQDSSIALGPDTAPGIC